MTKGSSASREGGLGRVLLLVPLSLLAGPAAIWPSSSYYFRDFLLAFYPMRLFAARELREGRLAVWNPYIHEGAFQLPSFYPPDLLHILDSSPVFVSWLLTLHLPLAAFAAYWLARELGVGRTGSMASGVAYSLGGLTLSCLNLYVFLQALALAPLVVGALLRVARGGRRSAGVAGILLGVALSTMAVEFVAQASALGVALALAARWGRRTLSWLAVAGVLAVGLVAVPFSLTWGFLPETVRGAGFETSVALGYSLHPAVLLQTVVPNIFGVLAAPAGAWWGTAFYSKGFPYLLSIYVGPLALALAWVGIGRLDKGTERVLLVLGVVGLWYALGTWGGLATLVAHVPGASSFRFPVKAVLLPFLAIAILAGAGVDRLAQERLAWRRFGAALGLGLGLVLGTAAVVTLGGTRVLGWAGVDPRYGAAVMASVTGDALTAVGVLGGALLVTYAAIRGQVALTIASAAVIGLLAADLGRAGSGMNPQVPSSFFERLPELAEVDGEARARGRVFSYGLDHSPAYRAVLSRGGRGVGHSAFFVHRQMLGPYTNIIDRIETPESSDLTSFVPRPRDLSPEDYDPARVATILPWLRNAAVGTVLSLDPLEDPSLVPVAEADAGPKGLVIHAYRLEGSWPRAYVACRAESVGSAEEGMRAPFRAGFDGRGEVAVEGPTSADCRRGRASMATWTTRREGYRVDLDGHGLLVVRASWARGWKARVDGREARVFRANGKHRAVPVSEGSHYVELAYEPPGLFVGASVSILTMGALVALFVGGGWRWRA